MASNYSITPQGHTSTASPAPAFAMGGQSAADRRFFDQMARRRALAARTPEQRGGYYQTTPGYSQGGGGGGGGTRSRSGGSQSGGGRTGHRENNKMNVRFGGISRGGVDRARPTPGLYEANAAELVRGHTGVAPTLSGGGPGSHTTEFTPEQRQDVRSHEDIQASDWSRLASAPGGGAQSTAAGEGGGGAAAGGPDPGDEANASVWDRIAAAPATLAGHPPPSPPGSSVWDRAASAPANLAAAASPAPQPGVASSVTPTGATRTQTTVPAEQTYGGQPIQSYGITGDLAGDAGGGPGLSPMQIERYKAAGMNPAQAAQLQLKREDEQLKSDVRLRREKELAGFKGAADVRERGAIEEEAAYFFEDEMDDIRGTYDTNLALAGDSPDRVAQARNEAQQEVATLFYSTGRRLPMGLGGIVDWEVLLGPDPTMETVSP